MHFFFLYGCSIKLREDIVRRREKILRNQRFACELLKSEDRVISGEGEEKRGGKKMEKEKKEIKTFRALKH